jgi:preprotein translocase subunit SecE
MGNILAFFKDVKAELAKVSWPTRKQTIEYTLVVVGISLTLAIFLGLLDFGFQAIVNRFILR